MNRTFRSAAHAALLLATACAMPVESCGARRPEAALPAPVKTPNGVPVLPARGDVRSPITARLDGPDRVPRVGDRVRLEWTVEELGSFNLPLSVSVRAPKGVEVTGDTSATVAGAAITKTGVLEVTVHAVPKEPLYLVVDGRSKHAGYHAEIPYRFGQPAPRVAEPVRGKEPVKVNGVDLGRPVMMP